MTENKVKFGMCLLCEDIKPLSSMSYSAQDGWVCDQCMGYTKPQPLLEEVIREYKEDKYPDI